MESHVSSSLIPGVTSSFLLVGKHYISILHDTGIMKYKGILYRSVPALRVIFDQNSVLVTLSQPLGLSDLSTGDP